MGLTLDAIVLHPRWNERVERAADEPAHCAADDRNGCRARELAIGQLLGSDRQRRLGPGHAHHDERHGEQINDYVEWCCPFDLDPAGQELSHRESQEGAYHVEREDPPAL